jgi:multiple sugar transport system substrate-binding protein
MVHPSAVLLRHVLCIQLLALAGCTDRRDARFDGVTLDFWHSFVASTQPALKELVRRFEEEHPHIRIREQYIPTGDGLVQKLISSLHTGTAPDISWVHGDFLGRLAAAGAIYPMDHFIHGEDGLSEDDFADIFPELIRSASWRDTLYAMPMEATLLALFYNKDRFREAGLDPERPPQTWQELREYTRALTSAPDRRGRIERYGFYVPVFPASGPLNLWMVRQWAPFVWQAGGQLIEPDQRTVSFHTEAGVQALTLWRDLYRDMRAPSYSFGHDMSFASGYVAMIMNGPWDLPRFRRAIPDHLRSLLRLPACVLSLCEPVHGRQEHDHEANHPVSRVRARGRSDGTQVGGRLARISRTRVGGLHPRSGLDDTPARLHLADTIHLPSVRSETGA